MNNTLSQASRIVSSFARRLCARCLEPYESQHF
ncbi:hypothetical protein CGRA01v4_01859 [Colletotrichum graminicola]|nr:hypothetical protein CGRA01v4_01859 [Colletotrichum graminicola]